ncbi:hypothetical protein NDU88_006819 [Pleurodeles waltl]|uniref:Uncharacterized protein n=1 Tax=Pleurodeles waltl TaxID=8319 RepID=A0AAV7PMZ6_PLEWA|nr:hypothetical protein NDU88_006819 [Pleurodeles waltl]
MRRATEAVSRLRGADAGARHASPRAGREEQRWRRRPRGRSPVALSCSLELRGLAGAKYRVPGWWGPGQGANF